jgi:hypothetical protein
MTDIVMIACGSCEICEHSTMKHYGSQCSVDGCECTNRA